MANGEKGDDIGQNTKWTNQIPNIPGGAKTPEEANRIMGDGVRRTAERRGVALDPYGYPDTPEGRKMSQEFQATLQEDESVDAGEKKDPGIPPMPQLTGDPVRDQDAMNMWAIKRDAYFEEWGVPGQSNKEE